MDPFGTAAGRCLAALIAPFALVLLTCAGPERPESGLARALLMLVCLGQVGGALARRLGVCGGGAERSAFTLLFGAAAGASIATGLGAVGGMRPPLFLGLVALAAAGFAVTEALGADLGGWARRDSAPRWVDRAAIALAVALAAATLGHDLHAARYRPPGADLYDDVSYHLPAAALWMQSGDLRMPRFDYGDRSTSFYPIFGELAAWTLLAPFPDSDVLARWSQLPAAVGLLLAVWALARRLGATPWGALVALMLTLGAPRLFPELALSAGSDVWAAFLALAALLAVRQAADSRGAARWLPLAVALGSLAGTKYAALLWLPWLAGAALAAGAIRRGAVAGRAAFSGTAVAAALVLLLPGSYAYLRNWVTAGNPVFPQPLTVAGHPLLDGWSRTALAARLEREGRIGWDLGAFISEPGMLGSVWSAALLPATLLLPLGAALVLVRRRGMAGAGFGVAVALGPLWMIGVYAFALHDHRDVRYALAAIPLAAASSVALAAALPVRWGRCAVGAAAAAALWAVAAEREAPHWPVVASAALAAALAWTGGARPLPAMPMATLTALLLAAGSGSTLERYAERRSRWEPAARKLERLTEGRPVTVAYVGGNRPYYLLGERLQNRVEIVPSRGTLAARHYRWGQPFEPDPYAGGRPAPWFRNLSSLGVEYVVVDAEGEDTRPARWLYRRSAPLVRIEAGEGWQIFSWRRAASTAGPPPTPKD